MVQSCVYQLLGCRSASASTQLIDTSTLSWACTIYSQTPHYTWYNRMGAALTPAIHNRRMQSTPDTVKSTLYSQHASIHRNNYVQHTSHLYSGFLINSITISLCGWICSIFSIRHRKGVGLMLPPYTPPMWSNAMALSTNSSPAQHRPISMARSLA